MTTYEPASAAERIGRELVDTIHTDLEGERIEYVFRDKAAKRNGKPLLGSARKVSGLTAWLSAGPDNLSADPVEDFFVIELAGDLWPMLTDDQRRALVDHELSHCGVDYDEDTGEAKLAIRPHDLEEFRSVVERHGLWQPDVEAFARTIEQRRMAESGQYSFTLNGESVTFNGENAYERLCWG